MAITYGFYDSLNGDRRYNAKQFSRFFDGIISPGVLKLIGDKFEVTPGSGMSVVVGTGRAWFNNTWTYNDDDYPLILDSPDETYDRMDSVALYIDEETRENGIILIKGSTAGGPLTPPDLTNTPTHHEYRLANITVSAGVTTIIPEDIESTVGTEETPYATLSDMNIVYDDVMNKPTINGIELSGNKTSNDLGVLDLGGGTMTGPIIYDSVESGVLDPRVLGFKFRDTDSALETRYAKLQIIPDDDETYYIPTLAFDTVSALGLLIKGPIGINLLNFPGGPFSIYSILSSTNKPHYEQRGYIVTHGSYSGTGSEFKLYTGIRPAAMIMWMPEANGAAWASGGVKAKFMAASYVSGTNWKCYFGGEDTGNSHTDANCGLGRVSFDDNRNYVTILSPNASGLSWANQSGKTYEWIAIG